MDIINYEEEEAKAFRFSDEGSNWYGDLKDRPEMEQRLQELQSLYYKTNDKTEKQNIWSEMFIWVQKYSRSLVLKKHKGKQFVDPDEVEDQATQTALAFMSQYIYRPGFHCGASFAGMINPKVLETLYKYNKDDHNRSLNSLLGDSNLEFEDLQERANFKALYDNEISYPGDFLNKVNLKDIIFDLLQDCKENELMSELQLFKIMCYMNILLRKSKNKHAKDMFKKHICNKKELDLVNIVELELFNRLTNYHGQ